MKKGDFLQLKIEGYAFEGKGVAKINPDNPLSQEEKTYVVFVHGAYPGDVVNASIRKIKKSFSEAKTESVVEPSPLRTSARCEYFGTCGGCKQQDLDYAAQVKYKQQQVEEIFRHIGGFTDFEMLPAAGSERNYFYRNKMEFSFADKRWLTESEIKSGEEIDRSFALGLHVPNVYDKVLDIRTCYLQSDVSTRILNFTRSFFKSRNTSVFTTLNNWGYLRNLIVRQSHSSDDLMVNLVTFSSDNELISEYTAQLLKAVPEITTIVNNVNTRKAMTAAGEYEKAHYGSGFIYDKIGGYKFRISANSFFQTNTKQAETLYRTACEFAEFRGNETVYDLYSGAGTIALYISGVVKEVHGFESVPQAVNDAEENRKINNVTNVHFYQADLYKPFLPLITEKKIPQPDTVILDPPRGGMHKNTVHDVISLNPNKIVYVSCNPSSQARDIKLFSEAGYRLIKMRPVDMFPQTYHIENVALIKK